MNAPKFTPGPWNKTLDSVGIRTIIVPAKGPAIATIENKGTYGSDVYAANARLIFAAPELYEALDQAVTSMQDSGYPISSVAVRAARAALAKARGETP